MATAVEIVLEKIGKFENRLSVLDYQVGEGLAGSLYWNWEQDALKHVETLVGIRHELTHEFLDLRRLMTDEEFDKGADILIEAKETLNGIKYQVMNCM